MKGLFFVREGNKKREGGGKRDLLLLAEGRCRFVGREGRGREGGGRRERKEKRQKGHSEPISPVRQSGDRAKRASSTVNLPDDSQVSVRGLSTSVCLCVCLFKSKGSDQALLLAARAALHLHSTFFRLKRHLAAGLNEKQCGIEDIEFIARRLSLPWQRYVVSQSPFGGTKSTFLSLSLSLIPTVSTATNARSLPG